MREYITSSGNQCGGCDSNNGNSSGAYDGDSGESDCRNNGGKNMHRTREESIVEFVFEEISGTQPRGSNEADHAAGGPSFDAGAASSLLEKLTGFKIPEQLWHGHRAVECVALELMSLRAGNAHPINSQRIIPIAEAMPSYPMSPSQKRLYLACQMTKTALYNMPSVFNLAGEINEARAVAAARALINRHGALRTSFFIDNDAPDPISFRQRVAAAEDVEIPLKFETLSATDDAAALLASFVKPFDLSEAPLFRIKIYVGRGRSYVLMDIHHIISDAVTSQILLREFSELYKGTSLPPPKIQYVDWSEWSRGRVTAKQKSFWIDMYQTIPPFLEIVTDFPRQKKQGFEGDSVNAAISPELQVEVEAFAARNGKTAFMAYLSALSALLGRYGRQGDVAIGCPISSRLNSDCEQTVGMFVNTLAFRCRPENAKPFKVLFDEVSADCLLGFENQEYPYEELVETLAVQREITRNPLFDVVFSMERRQGDIDDFCGFSYKRLEAAVPEAKFELVFTIVEGENGCTAELTYNTSLFRRDSAERMLGHYIRLLRAAVANPSLAVGELPLMSEPEYSRIVDVFSTGSSEGVYEQPDGADALNNDAVEGGAGIVRSAATVGGLDNTGDVTAAGVLGSGSVDNDSSDGSGSVDNDSSGGNNGTDIAVDTFVSIFRRKANAYPKNRAIILDDEAISYSELDGMTDNVARWLMSSGICVEDIVAVYSGRGFGYAIAAVGTMKAGAAFLPIDSSLPRDRISYMLKDSGAKAILAADAYPDFQTDLPILAIDKNALATGAAVMGTADMGTADMGTAVMGVSAKGAAVMGAAAIGAANSDAYAAMPVIKPGNLAYCIYTSGSTGLPKGVLIEHHGLVNMTKFFYGEMGISHNDIILQFASCSFDASVWELSMALTSGATLRALPPGAAWDFDMLGDYVNRCTIATLPPHIVPFVRPNGLRVLLTGGSQAQPETVCQVASENEKYINAYGPTEITVCATYWPYRGGDVPPTVPIGKPIPGVHAYILDGLSPCATGIPGELCVGGAGVGRGYINSAELTRTKFIDNPFGEGRLYRTGDAARWLPDGNIEFLGRLDEQVKIRGFRIELGEIEAALTKFGGVREAAVKVRESGPDGFDVALIGYVTSDINLDMPSLRESLISLLPDYMIPESLVQLDELPLTVSGKIDKRKLPDPGSLLGSPETGDLLETGDSLGTCDSLDTGDSLGTGDPFGTGDLIDTGDSFGMGDTPYKDDGSAMQSGSSETGKSATALTREEALLVDLFKKTLGVPRVNINDSFFALGGDSIKAIRIVSRIREYGYSASAHDFMTLRTVKAIAAALRSSYNGGDTGGSGDSGGSGASGASDSGAEALEEAGIAAAPMTPWQKMLVAKGVGNRANPIQSLSVYSENRLDANHLRSALSALAQRLPMLRAAYPGGEQAILPFDSTGIQFQVVDCTEYDMPAGGGEIAYNDSLGNNSHGIDTQGNYPQGNNPHGGGTHSMAVHSRIDPEHGPITEASLYRNADGDHLILSAHCLAIDHASLRIFASDLLRSYNFLSEGLAPAPPLQSAPFMDWARGIGAYAKSGGADAELQYWLDINETVKSLSEAAPPGFAHVSEGTAHGLHRQEVADNTRAEPTAVGRYAFNLGYDVSEQLLFGSEDVHGTGTGSGISAGSGAGIGAWAGNAGEDNAATLLLSALAHAARLYGSHEKISVHVIDNGRRPPSGKTDFSRTIGQFAYSYPVILESAGDIGETIELTKNTLSAIPSHGHGYGVLLECGHFGSAPSIPYFSFCYAGLSNGRADYSHYGGGLRAGMGEAAVSAYGGGCAVNIYCGIENGELKFISECNPASLGEGEAEIFFDIFITAVTDAASHSANNQAGGGDFGLDGDELEALNMLLA